MFERRNNNNNKNHTTGCELYSWRSKYIYQVRGKRRSSAYVDEGMLMNFNPHEIFIPDASPVLTVHDA